LQKAELKQVQIRNFIMADLEVPTQKPLVYKHIGLYGHAVGTFTSEFYWLV
jgi:hypothetical protein